MLIVDQFDDIKKELSFDLYLSSKIYQNLVKFGTLLDYFHCRYILSFNNKQTFQQLVLFIFLLIFVQEICICV